jgi:hypothetical protein
VQAHAETKLFDQFETFTRKLNDPISVAERDQLTRDMLKFHNESKLLMHIRDIQDEMYIVKQW